MPKHLKKINEEVIHSNRWWSYKHDQYENGDGTIRDYYYGETAGKVLLVPVLEDGRIILVIQHRYLMDKSSIEFPGGYIFSQTPLEAAKNRLWQETGGTADEYVKLGVVEGACSSFRDPCHVYLVQVDNITDRPNDDGDDIEVISRRPDEIDQMVRKNEIWDSLSLSAWALVHHYFLHQPEVETE